MYDIILKNCSIVNENQIKESDIAIKNQRIDLISTSIDSEAREVLDLKVDFKALAIEFEVKLINNDLSIQLKIEIDQTEYYY